MFMIAVAFDTEHFLSAHASLFQAAARDLMTDHIKCKLGVRHVLRFSRRDDFTVTQHRIARTDIEHFAELMRNKNDADALSRKIAHERKDTPYFRFRQRSRRFIHDDTRCIHHHRARNLHDLFVRRIETPHRKTRVKRDSDPVKGLLRLFYHRFAVEKTVFLFQLAADKHVFVDRQIVY